jgi:hypothetical protein
MTWTQAIEVLLILLGLIYAFGYAGWPHRGRAGATPATSEVVVVGGATTSDASDPEQRVAAPTSEKAAVWTATTSDASRVGAVDVSTAHRISGRYLGTRVGRNSSAAKSLGRAAPGTMSVGHEGVTRRPQSGTALRAEPATIGSVRTDGGAVLLLRHPDPATSHRTSFTADTAEGRAALLAALAELHGIRVGDDTTTAPDLTRNGTEMENL